MVSICEGENDTFDNKCVVFMLLDVVERVAKYDFYANMYYLFKSANFPEHTLSH